MILPDEPDKIVDTNVFIEYFRKKIKTNTLFEYLKIKKVKIMISSVTEYELLIGVKPETETLWREIIAECIVIPFDTACAKTAAEIRLNLKKRGLSMEIRDIFIAATAITHKLEIVSLNKKHFVQVDGLQIYGQ